MDPEEAGRLLRSAITQSGWEEILDFVAATPIATSLARMLLNGIRSKETSLDELHRLLRVVVRPETVLSSTEQECFLEHLFRPLWSGDRQSVYRTALRILRQDLRGLRGVEKHASDLCTASFEWSRLAGWAIRNKYCPNGTDVNQLEDALHHFVRRSRDRDFFPVRHVGPLPLRKAQVFEEFLLSALRLLLPGKGMRYQNELIASLEPIRRTLSMSGMDKLRALLVKIGRQDVWQEDLQWFGASSQGGWTAMMRQNRRLASVLTDVVLGAFVAERLEEAPETGPKYFAAFLNMSGMLEVPAGDVHAWKG